MGEILINFGENGQHLSSKTPWEREGARPKWLGRAGEEGEPNIYRAT